MQSKPAKSGHWIDLAGRGGDMGREDCQDGWHVLFEKTMRAGGTVLDVGAGLGRSRERIRRVTTQDPAPLAAGTVDVATPIAEIPAGAFDCVTAFDVIEHVVEDVDFLANLIRIARVCVFITTPNFNVSRAANGCHCREYTPVEFVGLVSRFDADDVLWLAGDGRGLTAATLPLVDFVEHDRPHQAALIRKEAARV